MQGFYFSRPIPPEEFSAFYLAHAAGHLVDDAPPQPRPS
jgi:hypothetical protein